MVGGYQIIDLKDCFLSGEVYECKKIIKAGKKPIRLVCNGISGIEVIDNWSTIGRMTEDGETFLALQGTFYNGSDEITVNVAIYDVPFEDGEYLVNTTISIGGNE